MQDIKNQAYEKLDSIKDKNDKKVVKQIEALIDEPIVVYKLREESSQSTSSVSICNKKECLIALLNVYEDVYDLFNEFSPNDIKIALGYLNYWVSRRLLYSNLDLEEVKIIIDEGSQLFENALNCSDLWINKDFKLLYECFSKKEYDLAYDEDDCLSLKYFKKKLREVTYFVILI